jgi:lysozyme family protein
MTPFEASLEQLIVVEGGYANAPADAGGTTMYGVTEAVARAAGYRGAMSVLPLSAAKEIYRERFWEPLSLDAIAAVSPRLAHELFDTAVHAVFPWPSSEGGGKE